MLSSAARKAIVGASGFSPRPPMARAAAMSLMALEPRMLFDGAIAATADAGPDPVADDGSGTGAAIRVAERNSGAPADTDTDTSILTAPVPNLPPVANPDERVIEPADGPIHGNVIAGSPDGDVADFDPEGGEFFVVGVVPGSTGDVPQGPTGRAVEGAHGTLVLNNDGRYTYTPDAGFIAATAQGQAVADTFSYLICDDAGNLATTTLTIRNDVPAPGADGAPGLPGDPGAGPVDPGAGPVDPGGPGTGPGDPTAGGPDPGPGDPATPAPGAGDPVDQGPVAGDPLPPVVAAPADPLPPTAGDPGARPDNGTVVGNDPVGMLGAEPAAYTLLSDDRLKSIAAPVDPSLNTFSPFAPLAVLGMVETPAGRESALAEKAAAPVAAHEDCLPAPKPKPKAVQRDNVLVDGNVVKPKPKAFTEQIQQEKQRVVPVKPKVVAGRQC